MNKIYLTTTLPYVNSKPHIGHALEFIQADALTRWHRTQGDDVFFNLGLDEHGQKVWNTANDIGIKVEDYVDGLAKVWKEFCDKFEIKYDNFYRTSDPDHYEKTKLFWNNILETGDIYKKEYEGLYCVGCESFKSDKDLVNNKCPDHSKTKIQKVKEENYFFRLSKYRGYLLNWLDQNPDFLQPKNKLPELRNLIENTEDISISRLKKNLPYGIPVPNDDTQVIYVWFEALLNYIFSCDTKERWTNSIQICGPDNLRFQAVIWQGILTSADLPHTKTLLVHGTILDEDGNKMSKSEGNVVDPIDQLEKFGLSAVRYYALVGLSTFGNGSWSEKRLIELYNAHLADDFGNLISRVLHLIDKFNLGIVSPSESFREEISRKLVLVNVQWNEKNFERAGDYLNEAVKFANAYINAKEPWKNEKDRLEVLSNLYWLLGRLETYYEPFIPDKIEEIREALRNKKKAIIFPKIFLNVE